MSNAPAKAAVSKRFSEMMFREKVSFIGKACVFFASGGFAYPTLWID
jgi:hypothetical protein